MLSTCRTFSLHKTPAWDQVASLHLWEAQAVSRGQTLKPMSSSRCYRCLQLPISDPSFLPFQAPDWLSHVWICPWRPIFAVSLWFVFQTVFYTPRAPQRHSLITICELFPEGFLLPHLKPHNYSAIKQQQYLQTEDKAPASPREGGLMPQPTALSPAPEISVPTPPVPGAKPSMRLQK